MPCICRAAKREALLREMLLRPPQLAAFATRALPPQTLHLGGRFSGPVMAVQLAHDRYRRMRGTIVTTVARETETGTLTVFIVRRSKGRLTHFKTSIFRKFQNVGFTKLFDSIR
jgi:hypothetical protein